MQNDQCLFTGCGFFSYTKYQKKFNVWFVLRGMQVEIYRKITSFTCGWLFSFIFIKWSFNIYWRWKSCKQLWFNSKANGYNKSLYLFDWPIRYGLSLHFVCKTYIFILFLMALNIRLVHTFELSWCLISGLSEYFANFLQEVGKKCIFPKFSESLGVSIK